MIIKAVVLIIDDVHLNETKEALETIVRGTIHLHLPEWSQRL